MKGLLLNRSFPWRALSRRVRKEQRNRECYSPTVSTYRWWARRSHALIGALLDRGCETLGPDLIISDPMAGGGTVAIEAARRGLRVHAQDVNPWATFGLKTTLLPSDSKLLGAAAQKLLGRLDAVASKLYTTANGEEIITQLHVRKCLCSECGAANFLFPTTLVALDSRITSNPKSCWLGCTRCGQVHQASWPKGKSECPACGYVLARSQSETKLVTNRLLRCSHCRAEQILKGSDLRTGGWSSALTIIRTGATMHIRPTMEGSESRIKSELGSRLNFAIPKSGETAALIGGGFVNWSDLFPSRQLRLIDEALVALNQESMPTSIRHRLLLAVAGFAEMAGYACRWDPKYRKVYEVTANHHYSRVWLAAETNPVGQLGRGTLPRRLAAAIEAVRWFPGSRKAKVTCASSKTQPIPTGTVDLVITDPPYYDSIQYAELSRLFRAFGSGLGFTWSNAVEKREAVTSRSLDCSHEEYVLRLTQIFGETNRTLKSSGRMLLTFHHSQTKAWEAMAQALRKSKFQIISVAVVHSENEKDFSKNNKKAITADAVFECLRKTRSKKIKALAVLGPKTVIARNVLAMGSAVAAYVNGSTDSLSSLYLKQVKRRRLSKPLFE